MKFALPFVLLSAFVAVSLSARGDGWENVALTVREVEKNVRNSLEEIRHVANLDSPELKYSVESKVGSAARRATTVFSIAKDAIRDSVYSTYEARELVDGIKRLFDRLHADIFPALTYSPSTTDQINNIINRAKANAETKILGVETYIPNDPHRPIDWHALDGKLQEIIILIHDNFENIKNVAITDDVHVGRNIESHLIDVWYHAKNIFNEARDAVRDQYIRNRVFDRTFDKIMYLLVSLKSNLQDELYQLTTGAAAEIRAILHYTRSSTDRKFRELFDILEN